MVHFFDNLILQDAPVISYLQIYRENPCNLQTNYFSPFLHIRLIFLGGFQLNLHNSPSISSQRTIGFNNISHSTPVVRPRIETAHSYHNTNFSHFEENNFSDYQTGKLKYLLKFHILIAMD